MGNLKKAAATGSLIWCLSIAPLAAQDATWVPADGNIQLFNGTPVCAMVLANGEYMFSCDGTGVFDLSVPLDANGQITLFSFADGLAPFSATLGPNNFPLTVFMETALPGSPLISMSHETECADDNWVRLTGEIGSTDGDPLCGMVLANGQHMFTCGESPGRYDLTVPPDENGQITIFGFADGFQPYSNTVTSPPCVVQDVRYVNLNGVEVEYFLESNPDSNLTSFSFACGVRCNLKNTTSESMVVSLYFNLYQAPNVLLQPNPATALSPPVLPPNSIYTDAAVIVNECDEIYSWDLDLGISSARSYPITFP